MLIQMKNITTISLPPDLKAVAKQNGSHRGIPRLSTYIQYLIQQDDHLIQDAKTHLLSQRVPTEADIQAMERAFGL